MICLDVNFIAKEDVTKFKGTLQENLTYEPNEYIIIVINGENVINLMNGNKSFFIRFESDYGE